MKGLVGAENMFNAAMQDLTEWDLFTLNEAGKIILAEVTAEMHTKFGLSNHNTEDKRKSFLDRVSSASAGTLSDLGTKRDTNGSSGDAPVTPNGNDWPITPGAMGPTG